MRASSPKPETVSTSIGELPLQEYHLAAAGRTWTVLHSGAILSHQDEQRFLGPAEGRLPYGIVLWPAAIALAHDVAARSGELAGTRILELGAGTGLPGIVAATLGAHVVQTERQEVAMAVCKRNAARNGASAIEHRAADWTAWDDVEQYDFILGADVLYGEAMHPHLRHIFETNLAPGGRVLLSDPFRAASLALLEALEGDGWTIALAKWTVGVEHQERAIGVYELAAPRRLRNDTDG